MKSHNWKILTKYGPKWREHVIKPHRTLDGRWFGDVGAAVLSEAGNIYTGVCVGAVLTLWLSITSAEGDADLPTRSRSTISRA